MLDRHLCRVGDVDAVLTVGSRQLAALVNPGVSKSALRLVPPKTHVPELSGVLRFTSSTESRSHELLLSKFTVCSVLMRLFSNVRGRTRRQRKQSPSSSM